MEQKAYIIGEKTVKKYLTPEDVIACVERTWKWYGDGKAVMPNKITTDMTKLGVAGWFNSMPAYIVPDVLAGKMGARTSPKERIYAQIIGTGMLDVAVAGLLLEKIEVSGEEMFRFDMTNCYVPER